MTSESDVDPTPTAQLLGTDSTTVFTATFISMISIALGVQSGLLIWRACILSNSSSDLCVPRLS